MVMRWLALLGTLGVLAGSLEAGAPDGFGVMTFNIRYDNPADGPNNWKHRRDGVAKLIEERKIAVAGLQEVQANQLDDLQERLPEYEFLGAGRDDGKRKGEFSPLLVRKSEFKVEKSGSFWLSDTPDKAGSKGWDAALPRVCTWAWLKHKELGDVLVASTHFDHKGQKARVESAKLIKSKLAELARSLPKERRVVLLGDFNCTVRDAPYRELVAKEGCDSLELQDAYDVSGEQDRRGPDSTWNGFKEIVPGQRIDFIFVSGMGSTGHEIIDARVGERFLSDHLPVTTTVQ